MISPKILSWIKELANNWSTHRVPTLAAALAYYAIFSLVPILLICIWIAGIILGEEAARGQILAQISGLLGAQTGLQIQELILSANHHSTALFVRIMSVFILVFSASGVYSEIQGGLNAIWGVKSVSHNQWFSFIKSRFLSITMVLISAFLLLTSLILSSLLAALSNRITFLLGSNIYMELIFSYVFSFSLITLLFAMMYKELPDIKLQWSDVWVGALITSLLFSLGKILIDFYLKHTQLASVFGTAGAFIVLVVWVYYSAQIFFIGAEITKIYSTKKLTKHHPNKNHKVKSLK